MRKLKIEFKMYEINKKTFNSLAPIKLYRETFKILIKF